MPWEGLVELYETPDHLTAEYCYAWGRRAAPPRYIQVRNIITILELPPVLSAETALKNAVADRENAHRD